MKRRSVLKHAGAGLAATSVALAGCSNITGGLEIADVDAQTTAFGNVEVIALVENTAGDSKSGTLRTQVDVQGGDTYTQERSVSVSGDSSNSYTNTHDIALSESLSADQFQYSAEMV